MITTFLTKSIYRFGVNKFNSSKDYYKILNLSSSADQKQIKKSFRQLAKQYHPDSSSGNEEKFKEVNEAYQVLSDESVKKQYDQTKSYGSGQHSGSNPYYNNPNYSQQSGYQNGQYYYNQQFHQNYQNPNRVNNNYRGYTRSDGWQNQKYRQNIMNQVFKQYQNDLNNAARHRSKFGSFQQMYQNHAQNIRQYTQKAKVHQQAVRKAFIQQEQRKARAYRQYQQKQMKDFKEMAQRKLNDMKDGIANNVHGFIKVGQFLKDTWNELKGMVNKNDKKK